MIIFKNHWQQTYLDVPKLTTQFLIGSSISLSCSKSTDEKDSKQQISKFKLDFRIFLGATSFQNDFTFYFNFSLQPWYFEKKFRWVESCSKTYRKLYSKCKILIKIIGLRVSFKIKISSQTWQAKPGQARGGGGSQKTTQEWFSSSLDPPFLPCLLPGNPC